MAPTIVAPEDRIATFDQDGTLWVEHPIYAQVVFALDRVVALAPEHPEWKTTEPFKTVLSGDKAAMAKLTLRDLEEIVFATHAGMSVEAFAAIAEEWTAKAKNPRWDRLYIDLVYQPMEEVLALLRANGFRTYIVTGGGQAFVRAYAARVYGIGPAQVIGSTLETGYKYDAEGQGELIREPKLDLNNNNSGKPEDIYLFTGLRPQAAFGNSTGDRRDAGMDHRRRRQATRHARPARRCRARVCLRPRQWPAGHEGRHVHASAHGRGEAARLGRDQHEERLEDDLSGGG